MAVLKLGGLDRKDAICLLALLLVAALLATGFFSLTWRTGDSSRYYVLARALALGEGYIAPQYLGAPPEVITPPGHPLVLAGIMKVFGTGMRPGKVFSALLYVLDMGLVFLCMRKAVPGNRLFAVCATLLGMCCVGILTMSCWYMSEMHYLFFSYTALLLGLHLADEGRGSQLFIVGLVCGWAYMVRSVGLSVVAGVGAYLLLKRRWSVVVPFAVGVVLVALPWFLRNTLVVGAPDTYIDQLSRMAGASGGMNYPWMRLGSDMARAFPHYFLWCVPTALFFQLYTGRNLLGILHLGGLSDTVRLVIVLMVVLGFLRRCRRFSVLETYWVFYWLIICTPPMPPQGNWYVYPMLPIAGLYLVLGIDLAASWVGCLIGPRLQAGRLAKAMAALCAAYALSAASVAAGIHFMKENRIRNLRAWDPERYFHMENEYMDAWARYVEAGEWIGVHSPPDTVVCSRKPQHTYLFANRCSWRYDKPDQVGGTNVWDAFVTSFQSRPVMLMEDAFLSYEGATFSYGHSHAALRHVLDQHPERFELVYETEPPTTRVWRMVEEVSAVGSED